MYFGASTLQFRFLKLFVFEVAALRLLSELDVLLCLSADTYQVNRSGEISVDS